MASVARKAVMVFFKSSTAYLSLKSSGENLGHASHILATPSAWI
jgi:hypothetical protein